MSQTPTSKLQSVQRGILSARSRRLRTTGAVLLAGILLMSLYGVFSLMPRVRVSAERVSQSRAVVAAQRAEAAVGSRVAVRVPISPEFRQSRRLERALAAQIIFVWIYWTICALLLLGLLLIAWLDFREVSRQYENERITLFAETAAQVARHKSDD